MKQAILTNVVNIVFGAMLLCSLKLQAIDTIQLEAVASGLHEPTDIQFIPNTKNKMVVLEKGGKAKIFTLEPNKIVSKYELLLDLVVNSSSEQGLLGLAFVPNFTSQPTIVINYNPKLINKMQTRISRFTVNANYKAYNERVILEIDQPYGNHKGGQVAFGPDGYLYIGLGDGGSANDPHDNAQNRRSLLGKILRLKLIANDEKLAYIIPADNPFVNSPDTLPEIWALGLRNPWRFSFDQLNRLIVADVGQNTWEEIDIVSRGDNMGWNLREAAHCFPADRQCSNIGLIDPIYEYGRQDGASVTGGYVYAGVNQALKNKYIFGDFVSGRVWALDLPTKYVPNKTKSKAVELARFKFHISTFGRDHAGEIYLADYDTGTIYKIISK